MESSLCLELTLESESLGFVLVLLLSPQDLDRLGMEVEGGELVGLSYQLQGKIETLQLQTKILLL